MITWSFTSLDTYEICPKMCYHRFVAKDVVDTGSEASKHGDRVHEHLQKRIDASPQPLPLELGFMEPVVSKLTDPSNGWSLIYAEKWMTLGKDMRELEQGWKPEAWVRYKADFLAVGPLGTDGERWRGLLVDWKTGKPREKELQLAIGAAVAFQIFPKLQKLVAFNYWTQIKSIGTVYNFMREGLTDLWRGILVRYMAYNKAVETGNFPPKQNPLCRYCPVTSCEHNKRGG